MTKSRVVRIFLPLLAAAALFAILSSAAIHAQDATARVTGTISDATGAVVPGAQVTVTNTATQVSRETTSDH